MTGRLLLLAVAALSLRAASTTAWEMNSYQDFLRGRFTGISLTRDGRLLIAPRLETIFAPDQPVIWSVVRAKDGTIYAATGHRGHVYRIDVSGASQLLWTAQEPEVFALALDSQDVLYAASSPDGKVYRIEGGNATEYFNPQSKYIWALAFGKAAELYVATGDQGKVFRVDGPGKGSEYYETGQSHVTCLAVDSDGRLLAGTEPNGILYRISAKEKAFVLHDASLPEIRAIVPAPDGSIYAAAMGGSLAKRVSGAAQPANTTSSPVVGTTTTTITVTDAEGAQSGVELKPKADQARAAAPQPATAPAVTPLTDLSGVEKAAIYKIYPDNTVETLWSSKEENIYDLVSMNGQLIFSTDSQGRIYRLSADRKVTLLVETRESETTRLIEVDGKLLAATGNMGKLFRLGGVPGESGTYISPVHDAGNVARWGKLNWRVELPAGTRVAFRTRSGNSARPDKTWSEWSQPITDERAASVASPNARYIQWTADFTGAQTTTPALDSVSLSYLPQNTPPVVKGVQVTSQAAPASAGGRLSGASQATPVYSITVTDTGESGASTASGTPTQALSRAGSAQMQIIWQAEDADGDRLVYSVYFRGQDEQAWKLLKANIWEPTLTLDGDILADGKYFFRVVASDAPSNPPGAAREAELISAPVLIDNTPPLVTASPPRRYGSRVEIDVEAVDATSAVRRAEYSVDAGPWILVAPEDGVADSPRERFPLRLESLPPGERLIVIRVYDAANNAGLAKVVLR